MCYLRHSLSIHTYLPILQFTHYPFLYVSAKTLVYLNAQAVKVMLIYWYLFIFKFPIQLYQR